MHRFLAVLLLFLVTGCSSQPWAVDHSEAYSSTGQHQIYVVSHGWHTGFVIPSKDVYKAIPALKTRFKGSPNIEFGWGDKGFYQAEEITSGLTLRAIFWPTESVIHAVAVPEDVPQYFNNSDVQSLCLNQAELDSLVAFIAGSFYRDKDKHILPQKNGIYGNSQFYKGVGDYYLLNTCNSWTAKGLKSVGMDISPIFKLTSGSIMDFLDDQSSRSSDTERTSPVTGGECGG
ncbi:TIGR02117 family protein [Litoribrevibacter euphylliae]|uniref:TIGR02117 family protein n=1 Tax=Litoribrevibacter euphylliae TaxID=1834034 RepID=A0ABV7H9N9_9GAMM